MKAAISGAPAKEPVKVVWAHCIRCEGDGNEASGEAYAVRLGRSSEPRPPALTAPHSPIHSIWLNFSARANLDPGMRPSQVDVSCLEQ